MKVVMAVILPIIVILTIESCARTLVTLRADLASAPAVPARPEAVPSRELGWERAPNFEGRLGFDADDYVRKHDAEGFLAYDTAQIQDTSRPRIIAIGDSNTYGWGVAPQDAWVEVLDRSLPAVSVINLGFLGYSSFQGYRTLLRYGETLKPQLILASFNYNDRRYIYDGNIDGQEKFSRNFEASRRGPAYAWLEDIYMFRLLRSAMHRLGFLSSEPADDTADVRKVEARVPPDAYRENLRSIAEYGRAHGIPVIFLLLKDNPYYTSQIWRGIKNREAGEYDLAARAFTIGLTNRASGALARKHLALTYAELGALEKADHVGRLERQSEPFDGFSPIYLDREYNEIMLAVGKEFGIEVVDARPMLDADPKVFLDICHPDEVGHARIAALMLAAIKVVSPALANRVASPGR
jgi:GDSL-like Lipase/Acylhydrolase family